MRILHTADWHLGRNLENVCRIDEQREFIDFLCRIAEERDIDLVLVAGDIYDTYNPSAAAEELFYEAVDRLCGRGRRAVVVIAGNHDNPDRLCAASPLAYKSGIFLLGYPASSAGGAPVGSDGGGGAASGSGGAASGSGGASSAATGAGIRTECGVEVPDGGKQGGNGFATPGGAMPAGAGSRPAAGNVPSPGANERSGLPANAGIKLAGAGPGWLELCIPGCGHNAVIISMPYPSESRLEELLAREADESALQNAYSWKIGSIFRALEKNYRDDTVNLLVAHLFVLGGSVSDSERTLQVGGALTVDPGILPPKAHYAALGHLHRPQEVRNAPCPAFYAGSPLAYSFSEAGYSKAVYAVEAMPGEKATVAPVYIDCGKPLRKWFAAEGAGQAIRWCEEGRDRNAWIDLEIATDRPLTADEQKCLRTLHPGIINIRPRINAGEAETFDFIGREGRKIDELFRDYYKSRLGADMPDELAAAFLEIVGGEDDQEYGGDYSGGERVGEGGVYGGSADGGGEEDGVVYNGSD